MVNMSFTISFPKLLLPISGTFRLSAHQPQPYSP
jgi:hypothetical protein